MVDGTSSFKNNLDPWDAYRVDSAEKSKAENQPPLTKPPVSYISDDDDYDGRTSQSISTKLFNSQSNSRSSFKKPNIEKETARTEQVPTTTTRLGTPVSSGKKTNMPSSNKMNTTKQRKRKTCLGQNVRTLFPPTPEMELSVFEEHMSLYVFGSLLDDREMIFQHGNIHLTREEFQNLCLGDPFDPEIYVPIHDAFKNHWFLMVISLKHLQIFWFDTFKSEAEIVSRTKMIDDVSFVASEIDIDKVKMRITLALISERFNVLHSKAECQA
ncbi:hypothetical protein RIF29_33796 [Crotalaria pallida]|uniref:Ubiquitin-like protease family profile domain-containing protein n=1 Tax=Crotalaria pallida TaxID=3830 RepID=A0AAN9EE08_CROPI